MKLHSYWVYIVECSDHKYYTGITNDLDRRLQEHNDGINTSCFTYKRRPVKLKYQQHFDQVNDAITWEKQIKGWSRKKKEALMRNDIEELKRLAARHPSSSSG